MLHGIEELTKDGEGYVYWRGVHVEHYSFGWSEDGQARKAESAAHLAACCRHIEALGIPVTCGSAVWYWSWFADLTPEILSNLPPLVRLLIVAHRDLYQDAAGRFCWLAERERIPGDEYRTTARVCVCDDGEQSSFMLESDELGNFYHPLTALGWQIAQMGQGKDSGCCYATTAQVLAWFRDKMPAEVFA